MRMCEARHCRTANRLPGPWNEFASMEWRACFQASRMTFRSSSTRRAFRVRPGAGRGTFTRRDCIRFMSSSSRCAPKYNQAKTEGPCRYRTRSTRVAVSQRARRTSALMHGAPEPNRGTLIPLPQELTDKCE